MRIVLSVFREQMDIDYTQSYRQFSCGVFLAGPTVRDSGKPSWRKEALTLLETGLKYQGAVSVPEPEDGPTGRWPEYDLQVRWEHHALDCAHSIAFWVPRNDIDMLGMTTNVEFGLYAKSEKIVLGYPEDATHMRYLAACARKWDIPVFGTLRDTLAGAVALARYRSR